MPDGNFPDPASFLYYCFACFAHSLCTLRLDRFLLMKDENHLLQKRVNLFDGISIVAGAMIGSGIFIVSADIARNVGSPGWLLVVWVITGIITMIGAISYGELAAMMPHVGGQYVYLKEAYHPLIGFLFGWTTFLVIQCGTIAAVAVAFAKFSGVLFPWISEKNILFYLGPLKVNSTMIIAIAMISFLTWVNTKGIVTGKTIQNIFTSTKVLALLGFIAIGFFATTNIHSLEINKEIFWQASKAGPGNQALPLVGFALITVATLGIWCPMKIVWICSKPCQQIGEL